MITIKLHMVQNIVVTCYVTLIFVIVTSDAYKDFTKDGTTTRPNTLFDDADDIQRQLDNEARDRMILGKPKTVWIFHMPVATTRVLPRYTRRLNIFRKLNKLNKTRKPTERTKDWSYKDQSEWQKTYPSCGGPSQSPVDIPYTGLVKIKGYRELSFINYNIYPRSLTLTNDGKRVILYGEWETNRQPYLYGGTAHSRKYIFHSMTLHWPSEHNVGGVKYPLESQIIHISAEYKSLQDAVGASRRDSLAMVGMINFYKFKNHTQRGLADLLRMGHESPCKNASISPMPLSYFNPPMRKYACYHGSLTFPPCTEAVSWLVRARALPVTREAMKAASSLFGNVQKNPFIRQLQSLNDRKVYYMN